MIVIRDSIGLRWTLAFSALAGCAMSSAGVAASVSEAVRFDIAAGDALHGLNEFGTQANLPVIFSSPELKRIRLRALHGSFRPLEALDAMIADTAIRYQVDEHGVIVLHVVALATAAPPAKSRRRSQDLGDRRSAGTLQEVTILTKRWDNNAQDSSIAMQSIGREEMDSAGLVTAQGALRTLPQVFGGGPTQDTYAVGTEARTNVARGSGVNLRGLGASATLVLMNGRRLPGAGSDGLFVDVSNVPLAAVERIDILPDSASTFYGSDAVAGVVNFVMRDGFDGRETKAWFGASTRDGGLPEEYVSQVLGGRTESGHGVLVMDFYSRGNLAAADREQAHSDLRDFGGSNFDIIQSNPGNIFVGGEIWAIPRGQDGRALESGDFSNNAQNRQNQYEGADILFSQQRWSVFGTWRQDLSDRVSVFGDLLVGQRDARGHGTGAAGAFVVPVTNAFYAAPFSLPERVPLPMRYSFYDDLGPMTSDLRVKSIDVTSGFEMRLGNRWNAMGTVAYAAEGTSVLAQNQINAAALNVALAQSDPETAFNLFGDGSHTNPATIEAIRGYESATYRSSIASVSALVSGPLMSVPGGDITLALGSEVRRQLLDSTLHSDASVTPTAVSSNRYRVIQSAFAEMQIPVVGSSDRIVGAEALALSIAERYERYSDFGRSLAARLGLSWVPVRGLTVRGSFSQSYRPPGLIDLDESNNVYFFTQLFDPRTRSMETVMLWGGKSRDLTEETARSWTAGLEFQVNTDAALAITYFNTDFTDRLSTPVFSADLLLNPTFQPLVTRDASADYRKEVCSRAPLPGSGFGDCLETPIAALIDLRLRNDARAFTNGLDLLSKYSSRGPFGVLSVMLNGTYIIAFSDARTSAAPLQNRVSTAHNPQNFRARASARWQFRGFDTSLSATFQNHYVDNQSLPQRYVSSWATFDVHAAYRFRGDGALGNTTVAFQVDNLFDTDPPFLNNAAASIGYDQENGDLTGRIIGFCIQKKW